MPATGAFCTILPSPDLLVSSLAEYAKDVVRNAFKQHRNNLSQLAESCRCSKSKLEDMAADQESWEKKTEEAFAEEVFKGDYYD